MSSSSDIATPDAIRIVLYSDVYQPVFKALNEEWIKTYFELEPEDRYVLDHPDAAILDKGGFIFIALYHGEPVGACALIPAGNRLFELAKMCVSPGAQGKNIGSMLCEAAISQARALGAVSIYLESNRRLAPAIHLYSRLGFTEVTGFVSKYRRVDIRMELSLD